MKDAVQTGCLILGILCLFYFVGIMFYVKGTEWFQFVWLFAGLVFLGLWRILLWLRTHENQVVSVCVCAVLILLLAGAGVISVFGQKVIAGMAAQPESGLDYVIVLGAQVRGTRPSRALRKRLDRALVYAKENPDTCFILSGGQGADEEISEALCMYEYLKENGLEPERMILESKSTSTMENLTFSAAFLDRTNQKIGILSNDFHIYRAMCLARTLGYEQICALPAESDQFMQPHYVLREICAVLVLFLQGKITC